MILRPSFRARTENWLAAGGASAHPVGYGALRGRSPTSAGLRRSRRTGRPCLAPNPTPRRIRTILPTVFLRANGQILKDRTSSKTHPLKSMGYKILSRSQNESQANISKTPEQASQNAGRWCRAEPARPATGPTVPINAPGSRPRVPDNAAHPPTLPSPPAPLEHLLS